MSRGWKTLLLVLVSLIVGLLLWPPSERMQKSGIIGEKVDRAENKSADPVPTLTGEPPSASEISNLAPDESLLRDEVKNNPHLPPPSLLRFSEQVSERTDEVLSDKMQSQELLRQLSDCANRTEFSPAVQVICLFQAERLSLAHSSLRPEFERARDQAAPETQRLFEVLHIG